jgi:ssDNA-binding Zn-finger/Zn-ribbon topoisomerase 1
MEKEIPREKQFEHALDRKEVRCPKCGKLLLKGKFGRGTSLELRCRGTNCQFHKKDLRIEFL